MKNTIFILLLLFTSLSLYSQIETVSHPKQKEKKQKSQTSENKSLFYIQYNYGISNRSLQKNGDFYGKELGERSSESPLSVSGFYMGINSPLYRRINLDMGLGFQQFGEQNNLNFSDTLIHYTNTYSNLVLPVKIHLQTGNRWAFFCNTGLQLQMLASYLNVRTVTINGQEERTKNKTLKDHQSISLSSTSSAGLKVQLSDKTSFYLSAGYVKQLTNTFNKQGPYIHKSDLLCLQFGLGFKM